MGELSTDVQQGGQIAAAQDRMDSGGLLAQIVAAAENPNIDAAKMQAMADLALRLQGHEQQQQFNRDMNAAIMAMPVITKAGRIEIWKDGVLKQSTPFAKFEDIDRVVRPICAAHNLSYSFEVGGDKGTITVRPIIRHANGHVERGEALPLPLEASGSKNPVQGSGSSVTYGKRYALCAAFSIVTEGTDVDGHSNPAVLPHEREMVVLDGAAAAHEQGDYQAWFLRQSPRDRAFLVASGKHVEYGGAALPPPAQEQRGGRGRSAPPQQQSAPPPQDGGQHQPKRTPAQLVDAYLIKIRECKDMAEFRALKDASGKFRDGIRENHEGLWSKVEEAENIAADLLAEGGES